jgi:hypothetical protein
MAPAITVLKYCRPAYCMHLEETKEYHERDLQPGSQIRLIPCNANRCPYRFKDVYGNLRSVYRFGVHSMHVVNRENVSGTQGIDGDEKS